LWSKDKDLPRTRTCKLVLKDSRGQGLEARGQGQRLEVRGQGLVNWSSSILEDKDLWSEDKDKDLKSEDKDL